MEIKLSDFATAAATSATVEVNDAVFAVEYKQSLIHQVIEAFRANSRQGTKAQKSRSEVSGGGVKPWRQKGTGRARAGTIRSPIWRGGGVTFAAKPRDFSQKINKKMYRGAICSILSELLRNGRLAVVNEINTTGKTKEMAQAFRNWSKSSLLIVTDDLQADLYLATRNLPNMVVCELIDLNPLALVGFDKICFTLAAVQAIEERLS